MQRGFAKRTRQQIAEFAAEHDVSLTQAQERLLARQMVGEVALRQLRSAPPPTDFASAEMALTHRRRLEHSMRETGTKLRAELTKASRRVTATKSALAGIERRRALLAAAFHKHTFPHP